MKTLAAFAVALVAFLSPLQAQIVESGPDCRPLTLESALVPAGYAVPGVAYFPRPKLAPETPVRVEVRLNVDFWYAVLNEGAPITGYVYGQGLNYTFMTPSGPTSMQLCSNICSGPMATGEYHEVPLSLTNVPGAPLPWITTAGQLPYAVAVDSYGGMQSWPGVLNPYGATFPSVPFRIASRNAAGATLLVTPL